jgi:hypothetical protein
MNEKNNRYFIAFLIIYTIISFSAGFIGGSFIGRTHTTDNNRVESNLSRERELLERIGEYQQREEERNRREAVRIAAEGERIKRTEDAIRAVRGLDRRSGDLLLELKQEIDILADYFRDSRSGLYNELNNPGSE